MPYAGEHASSTGHSDLLRRLDFTRTVSRWDLHATRGTGGHPRDLVISPAPGPARDIDRVVAVDGSMLDLSPGASATIFQIGTAAIDLRTYAASGAHRSGPVDLPLLKAALHEQRVGWCMASSGASAASGADEIDLWREDVFSAFADTSVAVSDTVRRSVLDGLMALYGTPGRPASAVLLDGCPCGCPATGLVVPAHGTSCPSCGGALWPTDVLRLESEYEPQRAVVQLMLAAERLVTLLYIDAGYQDDPSALGRTMFFTDGPLAFFGATTRLKTPMISYWQGLVKASDDEGFDLPILVGVEKSGYFVDHARQIAGAFAPRSFVVPTDAYIATEIAKRPRRPGRERPFGVGTHYGRQVLYKSAVGQMLVLSVPTGGVPYLGGACPGPPRCPDLATVFRCLDDMASAVHPEALFPVVEANRVAALPEASKPLFVEAVLDATRRVSERG